MKLIYIIILSTFLFSSDAVKTFYTGDVYEFAENDMLEDIQNQITNNKSSINKKLKKWQTKVKKSIKSYQPKDLIRLQSAVKDNIFYPDMSYKNPNDIRDNNGRILYPRGFTFNPLDFQTMHVQIIVIDGSDDKEIKWLIASKYTNNIKYKIIISDGNYLDVEKEIKQNVFYHISKLSKFKLKYTPSIITQIGNVMEVKEICINCKKDNLK